MRKDADTLNHFKFQCKAVGLPIPTLEHRFAKEIGRQWRFDIAFTEQLVAVEINGGNFVGGRHSTGPGLRKEYEKLNHAQLLGWQVYQFLPEQVRSGEALAFIEKVLR